MNIDNATLGWVLFGVASFVGFVVYAKHWVCEKIRKKYEALEQNQRWYDTDIREITNRLDVLEGKKNN